MHDVGILGGGVSGLFTAYFLGGDVEVLEARRHASAASRGASAGEGFRSRHRRAHPVLQGQGGARPTSSPSWATTSATGVRANKILYKGLHVKYPFENGIDVLPKEDIADILHYVHRQPAQGQAHELPRVDVPRVRRRPHEPLPAPVQREDLEDAARGDEPRVGRPRAAPAAHGSHEDRGGHPDRGLHAPALLPVPRARRLRVAARGRSRAKLGNKITTGFRVAKLRPSTAAGRSSASKGEERRYRQIIATIPIGTLFAALGDVPADVSRGGGSALRYNSLRVALVGVERTTISRSTPRSTSPTRSRSTTASATTTSSARTSCPAGLQLGVVRDHRVARERSRLVERREGARPGRRRSRPRRHPAPRGRLLPAGAPRALRVRRLHARATAGRVQRHPRVHATRAASTSRGASPSTST